MEWPNSQIGVTIKKKKISAQRFDTYLILESFSSSCEVIPKGRNDLGAETLCTLMRVSLSAETLNIVLSYYKPQKNKNLD